MLVKREKAVAVLREAAKLVQTGFVKGHWIKSADNAHVEWAPWQGHSDVSRPLSETIPPELLNANECQVCGEGAVYLAAAREGLTYAEATELIDRLERQVLEDTGASSMPDLNDSLGTRRTTVVKVIESTADRINLEEPV